LNDFVDNTRKKDNDSQRIYKMHNFNIDVIWPVWIFFPEEIHTTNLTKNLYAGN